MNSPRTRDPLMTADEVARLIAVRFPQWAGLMVEAFPSTGTDNLIFRLGDRLTVRVPRTAEAAATMPLEFRALTAFRDLPLETPGPVALSTEPPFAIYRWIEGATPLKGEIASNRQAATALGQFLSILRDAASDGGRASGKANEHRGGLLAGRDRIVRAAIAALEFEIDTAAAARCWEAVFRLEPTDRPRWLHGDLHPGNLIVRDGDLVGVIDFGLAAVGDAAADLAAGWMVFDASARPAFRAAAGLDDAAWARGRGWALYQGLIALAYYRDRNPALAAIARAAIERVLADPDVST